VLTAIEAGAGGVESYGTVACRGQDVKDEGVEFGDAVSHYCFCKVISVEGVYTRFDKRGDHAGS
jgi:hypothetical protein